MPNGDILGDKLYQKRASKALPILVRQAELRSEIHYSALAEEIGMKNPRDLNNVLDCVGIRLETLSREWDENIPPIQIVVVNKQTRFPSDGVGWIFRGEEREWFDSLPHKERWRQLQSAWAEIYDYKKWLKVLEAVGLEPIRSDAVELVRRSAALGATSESRGSNFGAGGESKAHRKLKDFVASHPEILGLPARAGPGGTEVALPSGDKLDVLFVSGQDYIAVEVKSALSSTEDIARECFNASSIAR